jgi:hypothetical protein
MKTEPVTSLPLRVSARVKSALCFVVRLRAYPLKVPLAKLSDAGATGAVVPAFWGTLLIVEEFVTTPPALAAEF